MIDATTNPTDGASVDPRQSLSVDGRMDYPLPAWSKVTAGLLGLLCFILTLSGLWHQDIGFDEDVDHQATIGLRENPLTGNGINGSQARLPHYATLVAYRITETLGLAGMLEWNIVVARAVSSAAAAFTVLLIFLLGHRASGTTAGLAAAATLSIAPYFLGFGGLAYTNGDAFCPLLVTATVLAYLRVVDVPSGPRLCVLAVLIGLTVASKFLLVMILPGLVLCDFLNTRAKNGIADASGRHRTQDVWLPFIAITAFVVAFGTMITTQNVTKESIDNLWMLRMTAWFFGLTLTCLGLFRLRRVDGSKLNWFMRWFIVLPLAAGVSLVFFPEHVLHPNVYAELFSFASEPNGSRKIFDIRQAALVYGSVFILKLGLPLGVSTIFALVWAPFRSVHNRVMRAIFMVFASYGLFLVAQPFKQTFHLMPIYPLLVCMLCVFLVRFHEAMRPASVRVAFVVVAAFSYAWLLYGVVNVYPHFRYYGYETVGASWRGYETRGFLGLVLIDQEGNREALEWCKFNLPPQTRVVSALRLLTSVERTMKATPHQLDFVQLDWPWLRKKESDWEIIRTADYFILHINNRINDRATPTQEQLETIFEKVPVHTVYAGRGVYQIPVVEIFKRRVPSTP